MGRYGFLGHGPLSALGRDHSECVLWFVGLFTYFYYFRKKGVFPCYKGTLMVVPDSSSRAFAVVSVRNPQRLVLADGTFSPLVVVPFRGGTLAHPRVCVATEALEGCAHSCKVFHSVLPVCEVLVSTGLDDVLPGLGGGMHMCRHLHVFGACPGGVVVHRAPEPGPAQGDRCELSDLLVRPFTALPRGRRVRCPRLPSYGS
jgi:hypothetical protein